MYGLNIIDIVPLDVGDRAVYGAVVGTIPGHFYRALFRLCGVRRHAAMGYAAIVCDRSSDALILLTWSFAGQRFHGLRRDRPRRHGARIG